MQWTEEEDFALVRWCLRLNNRARERAMDTAIGHKLGRSPGSIKKRRQQLARVIACFVRPRRRQEIRKIIQLREAGMSYGGIANKLGTTKGAVAGVLRDLGRVNRESCSQD